MEWLLSIIGSGWVEAGAIGLAGLMVRKDIAAAANWAEGATASVLGKIKRTARAAQNAGDSYRLANEKLREQLSHKGVFANCDELKQAFELLDDYDALIDRRFPLEVAQ